jgi:hypothetical protein
MSVMVTEQDNFIKEMWAQETKESLSVSEENRESYLPVIIMEDGSVQIDPRFTTHA